MKVHGFEVTQLPDGSLRCEGREPMSLDEIKRYLGELEMQRVRYETQRMFDELLGCPR